ncbi:MAG: tRNA (N(6)-L-threonylcarbamoyladenosine(37)-C(2))-methylthiotransferase MtaB [Bacteroidales bacterium]
MKISFYNIGCKVNYADMSYLQELFLEKGHKVVPYGDHADIIFINTCTVTNTADSDCRKLIRKTHRQHPDAYIGVFGCYAQLKPDEISAIEGVDLVIGTKNKFDIDDIIKNIQNNQSSVITSDLIDINFVASSSSENKDRTRVFLKIQDGCDYKCTYCTIPLARGKCRSMPFNDIIPEIRKIQSSGAHEIILSGINLGEYKTEDGYNFQNVVHLLDQNVSDMRFRISSIEPNLLTSEIIECVSQSQVFCPHFHIPLQSGSDDVLKTMKRRYNISKFRDLISEITTNISNVCIGIDVIAGFPGETDENFEETYNFLDSLPISHLHVFTYSERSNTPAATYENSIPMHIRKERTKKLRELSDKKLQKFYASQIDSERKVLPESYNSKTGLWTGWTENYVKVCFPAPQDLAKIFHNVRLIEVNGDKVKSELV